MITKDSSEKKTILLVDDEIIFVNALSKKMQSMGYDIVIAHSGEEAIEFIRKTDNIDLILMEVDLGVGLNGIDASERILSIKTIPIVFHTSHLERKSLEQVNSISRYGFIIKNSDDFTLESSLSMAFKLFETDQKLQERDALFYQNTTERKENEKKAKDASNFLNSIIENIPNMIFMKHASDLRFVLFNRAGENLLGYDRKDLLGKNDYDFFPKEQADFFTQKDRDVIMQTEIVDISEEMIDTPKGTRILHTKKLPLFDENGKPEYLLGISEDITERKESEKKIRENIERYDRLTQTVPGALYDYVLHHDGRSQMIFISSKCVEIFEVEAEEIMKDMSVIWAMTHPDDLERFSKENEHAARFGEHFNSEVRIITPSGKVKWIEMTSRPNPTSHPDEPAIWSGFAIDITNRKLAEEKIRTLLHEKDLLLREVHHRIKNNMLTITSLLFLQTESLRDPAAISALNDAISRIQSMVVLYDKLYRSSEFNELSVLDYLSPLVDEIVNNFPNYQIVKIEKNIEDFVLPTATLFPIGIMINELLTNAMKYAFVGRSSGVLTVSATKKENQVFFSIQDDGIGMKESEESFTGFGLQLVTMLAKQIRGKVHLQVNNGTKFTLEFGVK